jgi:hypothetical protein
VQDGVIDVLILRFRSVGAAAPSRGSHAKFGGEVTHGSEGDQRFKVKKPRCNNHIFPCSEGRVSAVAGRPAGYSPLDYLLWLPYGSLLASGRT